MSETFLEIVNRILTDTDDEPVATIEGDNLLPHTIKVKEWVNDGYDYCFKKIFQTTWFKDSGYIVIGPDLYTDSDTATIIKPCKQLTQYDNFIIDEEEIPFLPLKEFNQKTYNKTGKPECYTLYKNTIQFKPKVDKEYTIYYCGTKKLIPLEYDDDIPFINPKILIAYGIHKQYSLDYNGTDMNSLMIFDELVKAEITALANTQLFQQKLPEIGYKGWYSDEQN